MPRAPRPPPAASHDGGRQPAGRPRTGASWCLLVATVGGVLGLCALASWEVTLTRQSSVGHWSVGATIAAAVVAAIVVGRGRQIETSRSWRVGARRAVAGWRQHPRAQVAGVVGWVVIGALAIGWDLNSFIHQSHELPTLSDYIGKVTAVPAGRGLLFLGWAALGAYLALGRRRAR